MNLRLALYALIARHDLDAARARRLTQLAGLDAEPAALARWLPRGVAVLAAALAGFGVILWVAANWDALGRSGRFALLQGVVLAACVAAWARPAWRAPFGLLALLAIGALFAFFGQTYQTGADPWQLFALWALLALPLALAARSDVVWAPWALIVMTAISLWTFAHTGHRWRVAPGDLRVHALAFAATAVAVAVLGRAAQRFTGAGVWALRAAATLAVVMVASAALAGLFQDRVAPHYVFGLAVLAAAAAVYARRAAFEVYVLSALAFGAVSLIVAGLARLLFDRSSGDQLPSLLLLGIVAMALLAGAVSAIMRLARVYGLDGARP